MILLANQWFKYCLVTTIPEKYVLPNVNHKMLEEEGFDFEDLKIEDKPVNTFVAKLHEVVHNSSFKIGMP